MSERSDDSAQDLSGDDESFSPLGATAIVIGGSMAGLLAARVLAEFFERVIVLDRDRLPADPGARAGVPQARHAHALLAGGLAVVERLFPKIGESLTRAGATTIDWGSDFAVHAASGWMPRAASGIVTYGCSRDLLESFIRRTLASNSKISFVDDSAVESLLPSSDGSRVQGARVRSRAGRTRDIVGCDLVVDASGRGSHAPSWLASLGYDRPREIVVASHRAYATRWFAQPSGARSWKALLQSTWTPDVTRGGLIYPAEGDRWCVTLSGAEHHYPPVDAEGFLEFARRQPTSVLYEAIRSARPISRIYGFRRLENRRRLFHHLARWPDRFVVMGDAACAFNPVFAQGMSVSARSAMALHACLRNAQRRGSLAGATRRILGALARTTAAPWFMTTVEDLRWAATEGATRRWYHRLAQRYLDRVSLLASSSAESNRRSLEVWHLLRGPTALLHPSLSIEVLRTLLTKGVRPLSPA